MLEGEKEQLCQQHNYDESFRTVDERANDLGYKCSSMCCMKLVRSCRSKDKEKKKRASNRGEERRTT